MVKIGLVNLYDRYMLSISSENGERDICYSALLIASILEVWEVKGSPRPQNVGRWGGGIPILSLCGKDSSLLCLHEGVETVLSLWGGDSSFLCLKGGETVLSLWGGDCLLSQFPCRFPMLLSSLQDWFGVGLGPFSGGVLHPFFKNALHSS